MSEKFNIQKNNIKLDKKLEGAAKVENEEKTISLPEAAQSVVDVEARTKNVDTHVKKNKVFMKIKLKLGLLYLDEGGFLREATDEVSLDSMLELRGAVTEMKPKTAVQISQVNTELINQGLQAKIRYKLNIFVEGYLEETYEVVTSMEGTREVKVKKETLLLENMVKQEYHIEEIYPEIRLPEEASRILKIDVTPSVKSTEVKQQNVNVKGELNEQIYYVNLQGVVCHYHENVPFQLSIGMPEASPEQVFYISTDSILENYRLNEEDPVQLRETISLVSLVTVEETREVSLVTHVAAPGLKVNRIGLSGESRVMETSLGDMLSKVIHLSGGISEIFQLKAELFYQSPEVQENRVTVEGELAVKLFYRDEQGEFSIYRENYPVRFSGVVSTLEPGNRIEVTEAVVEEASYQQNDQEEVELNIYCRLDLKIKETLKEEAVLSVEEVPLPVDVPTKIYIMQEGDNLDKVSWRFQVPVEDLQEANPEINDPGSVYSGQKIRIPVGKKE